MTDLRKTAVPAAAVHCDNRIVAPFKAVVVGPQGRRVSKVKVDIKPVIKKLAAMPATKPGRRRKRRTQPRTQPKT